MKTSPKKIALINPPAPFLISERVFPNLGLVQLSTSIRLAGHEVQIFDFCGEPDAEKKIKKISKDFEFYGFSSTSPQFTNTFRLNKALKEENPQAYTILGGAHASAMYASAKNSKDSLSDPNVASLEAFDRVVSGEGELSSNEIFSRQGPRWHIASTIDNLDSLPFPDRSLIEIHSYKYIIEGTDRPTTTIMTQRGCPFKCSFCCGRDIPMYRRARAKSPEKVVEELNYLNKEFGFSSFMWFDDELNINPKRLLEFSKLLQGKDYIHRGFIRSDLLLKHPDTLDALIDAGFVELCSGFEYGSKRLLDVTHKGTTPEQNAEAAKMIMNRGIRYKCFGMIGGPGETYEEAMQTKRWLQEVKPNGFDITILSPYPGSILYDNSLPSTKYLGYDREWKGLYFKRPDFAKDETFYKGIPGKYPCNIRTDDLTSEDLISLRDEIDRDLKKK